MRSNLMAWVVCLVAALGASGCDVYEDIDIENLCHPDDPECAELDWDGDGVANAVDDFPADAACAVRDDDNCSACGVGCGELTTCDEAGACVCLALYTGEDCGEVIIAAGTHTVGSGSGDVCSDSDEKRHTVILSRPFAMKRSEVTQAEWYALMGNNPAFFSEHGPGADCGEECPVERVSWFDAVAYCNAMSEAQGLEVCYTLSGCVGTAGGGCDGSQPSYESANTDWVCWEYGCQSVTFEGLDCEGYRLPTEAEWEVAARAGTATATYAGQIDSEDCSFGSSSSVLEPIAWCGGSGGLSPVGQKEANAWGLHDMLGNVWEWVWNWYGPYSPYADATLTDPVGPSTGADRVLRGGSWYYSPEYCRAAKRDPRTPTYRRHDLGFRTVRTLP